MVLLAGRRLSRPLSSHDGNLHRVHVHPFRRVHINMVDLADSSRSSATTETSCSRVQVRHTRVPASHRGILRFLCTSKCLLQITFGGILFRLSASRTIARSSSTVLVAEIFYASSASP
ncbi:hypothetical protein PFISCL1PPCAC_26711, partial [Pristionchus fissidentatus]